MIKLFLKIFFVGFSCAFLVSCKQKMKKIKNTEIFTNKEINLGTVSKEDTVRFNIEVVNPMNEDLIIKKTSSNCGCTLVNIKDSIIKPNNKTQLKMEFIPGLNRKGNVSQAIVVETNTAEPFHEVIIKANVK